MPGFFEIGSTRYCIVTAETRDIADDYFPAGPPLRNPRREGPVLFDRLGSPLENTVAVPEENVWVPSTKLLSITGWEVLPFSPEFLELPLELVDTVLTNLHLDSDGRRLEARINWNGIEIRKVFHLTRVEASVALWPSRILEDWRRFFMAFGPREGEEEGPPVFAGCEPRIFGLVAGTPNRVVRGRTRLVDARAAAFAEIEVPPRWIGFAEAKGPECLGLLPLQAPPNRPVSRLTEEARPGFRFAALSPVPRRPPVHGETRIALDFGTSNTAIACPDGSSGRLLEFTPESVGVDLTAQGNREAKRLSERWARRFFPLAKPYGNPIATVLLADKEDDSTFDISEFYPAFSIPGLEIVHPRVIGFLARDRQLKQDFKWADGVSGDRLRKAFLEQLGIMTAWELRTSLFDQVKSSLKVVYTCPLSFSIKQNDALSDAVSAFASALRAGGLTQVSLEGPLSESLANFYYVRERAKAGGQIRGERHVVMDVGGGTTDISIFDGFGKPLYLDSLYIGGKDLARTLLSYAAAVQRRSDDIARAVGGDDRSRPKDREDAAWAETIQLLLIGRMKERDQDLGPSGTIEKLAEEFRKYNLQDLLGEFTALLAFASAYAIRMALLPQSGEKKVTKVIVHYVGMGSRLFDMSPRGKLAGSRWQAAKQILKEVVSAFPESEGASFDFKRDYGKETVSCGALSEFPEDEGLPAALDVHTLWWSDAKVEGEGSAITWRDPFSEDAALDLPDSVREASSTIELYRCFEQAVLVSGRHTFDGWRANREDLAESLSLSDDAYRRGWNAIRTQQKTKPRHPVRIVTDVLKDQVCKLIEDPERGGST